MTKDIAVRHHIGRIGNAALAVVDGKPDAAHDMPRPCCPDEEIAALQRVAGLEQLDAIFWKGGTA
jgi:hypothetical protein